MGFIRGLGFRKQAATSVAVSSALRSTIGAAAVRPTAIACCDVEQNLLRQEEREGEREIPRVRESQREPEREREREREIDR